MTIKPLSDKVVTRMTQAEETTKSGIILTAAAKEKPSVAEVVAVGPGAYDKNGNLIPMTVKVGDKVLVAVRIIETKTCGKYRQNQEEICLVSLSIVIPHDPHKVID